MMNKQELFEAAKSSDEAKAILWRDGHRSLAYWRQVSTEFEKLKRAKFQVKKHKVAARA